MPALPALEREMSRLRLLVSEAWSSIRMNASTTVAATMTVLIGMFLLGVFVALGTWVLSWSDHVKRELQVKVYFERTATPAQEAFVGVKLRADPRVKQGGVVFISKAQAEAKMRKQFPQLYATPLPSNPLPDSYLVTPTKAEYTPRAGTGDPARALSGRRGRLRRRHLGQLDGEARADDRGGDLDRLPRRGRPARRRVDAADREHDQALDLRAPPRDRGDEARRARRTGSCAARSCSRG